MMCDPQQPATPGMPLSGPLCRFRRVFGPPRWCNLLTRLKTVHRAAHAHRGFGLLTVVMPWDWPAFIRTIRNIRNIRNLERKTMLTPTTKPDLRRAGQTACRQAAHPAGKGATR